MNARGGVGADLQGAPDLVAAQGSLLGRPMHLLASTTSTNDDAKRAARQGAPHGATWVSESQTSGRGRHGRTWVSAPGDSLLLSVLVRESIAPSRLPELAIVAGLAVRDAVARAAPRADVVVKWPNDVLVGQKKIAGVLVEAVTVGSRVEAVVIGVGINVHTRSFPDEIASRATSLALVVFPSRAPERARLLADILAQLDSDVRAVVAGGLVLLRERIEAADALRGRTVQNDAGDEGIAGGIDDAGRLIVRSSDGAVRAWTAGEVHLAEAG